MNRTIQAGTTIVSLVFFVVFMLLSQQLEMKAYAAQVYGGPEEPFVPPQKTWDPSAPAGILKFSYARVIGDETAVYLNIPSNQIVGRVTLPSAPAPVILAKYDPANRVGTVALMRVLQVGPLIKAEIVQLTPQNIHHFMGKSFWNFSWLDFNYDPGCDINQKMLGTANPQIDNGQILHDFLEYDRGAVNMPPFFTFTPSEQEAINASSYFWHQRLNNDPCWAHVSLSGFDVGDGNFHNISQQGFFDLVAFLQGVHKAAFSAVAMAKIRPEVKTETHKSFFTKTVKETINYWLSPDWYFGTATTRGISNDIVRNPAGGMRSAIGFVHVQGQGSTIPADEYLLYTWSKQQSGFTGLFVFVACIAIGALTGGLGSPFINGFNVLTGAAVGAVGGLVASGGSPTTNTTASITPFIPSSYDFSSPNLSGDNAIVASRTDSMWLNTPPDQTPGGFESFVVNIDARKALACGGASHATDDCTAAGIEQLDMSDPRYPQVLHEMFFNPSQFLQQHNYPWAQQ